MLDATQLWQAVSTRDKALVGRFFFGVLTTKVFCSPGCPSRMPRPENVRYYETAEAALAEGLRACLRCRPLAPSQDAVREKLGAVCRFIRNNLDRQDALTLQALGGRFGMSAFHLQRTFKAVVGLSPRQYVEGLRMEMLKANLKLDGSVTSAIYEAGFGSGSRVYSRVNTSLGMTPRQYRSGGENVELSYATIQTPLGLMMLAATDRGLCFLEFGASDEELLESLNREFPSASKLPLQKPYPEQYTAWVAALSAYLAGEQALQKIPLAIHGTAFQMKVWNYLQTIPGGTVQSYTEVAHAIGRPRAVRAVASACAANRVAVVIPCHRVIRGDGGLGGYRWGLDRKRTLIDSERLMVSTHF